ncbi:alpha/beta fold hydrolase [Halobacillus sp. BBL2006]|uniref:alpha/beta fold hydrolase n=1 Tax=Halobacillus sp. BBL2006 TaxID=1543706 RepID=UPI00054331FC|nr:alpha/beta hydrolase [Halobacillus sp. BBL2006]KHE72882.1 hypothetical protein LD39_02190 [Halobacillus sp. BBL2006]
MINNVKRPLGHKVYRNEYSHEWVILFHGFGGNHKIFYKQMDEFKANYNLLLIDLPGHGASPLSEEEPVLIYTGKKVIELMDLLHINRAHFVGVSLGTLVIQHMATKYPLRIQSMILSGAVGKWLWWGEALGKLSLSFPIRHMLPYMFPYACFAYILMPKKNHKKSRNVFIKEALKLGRHAYLTWLFTVRDAYQIYGELRKKKNNIPKLYISGEEDHMFLPGIRRHVCKEAASELVVIPACGHVCNIEKASDFNALSLNFLNQISPQLKRRLS